MKIKIEPDVITGFYWSIHFENMLIIYGCAKTYQGAEENALIALKKIAKDIDEEIKAHKLYQKKPCKAFQWNSCMKYIDGVVCRKNVYWYNDVIINDEDWILPETGEVVSNKDFINLFEEV